MLILKSSPSEYGTSIADINNALKGGCSITFTQYGDRSLLQLKPGYLHDDTKTIREVWIWSIVHRSMLKCYMILDGGKFQIDTQNWSQCTIPAGKVNFLYIENCKIVITSVEEGTLKTSIRRTNYKEYIDVEQDEPVGISEGAGDQIRASPFLYGPQYTLPNGRTSDTIIQSNRSMHESDTLDISNRSMYESDTIIQSNRSMPDSDTIIRSNRNMQGSNITHWLSGRQVAKLESGESGGNSNIIRTLDKPVSYIDGFLKYMDQ